MIFGSSEERAQKNRQKAHELNEQGNTAYTNGDYATAIQLYRQALSQSPHDAQIQDNLRNAEAKLREQQDQAEAARREEQERVECERAAQQLDAEQAARIRHDIVGPLAGKLQRFSAGVDFDQNGAGAIPQIAGGLEFLPTATAPPPPAPPPAAVIVDSSVVDLRDATTLTMDPAKVKGQPVAAAPSTIPPLPDASFAMPPEDVAMLFPELSDPAFRKTVDEVLAADARGDADATNRAMDKLNQWWKPIPQKLEEMHSRTMGNVNMFKYDPKYRRLMQQVREEVRQAELAELEMADQQAQQEIRELLQRAPSASVQIQEEDRAWFMAEVQNISERERARKADTLRIASEVFQAKVQQLRQ
jgi:tetratricopeptide (TPR) repeat protein